MSKAAPSPPGAYAPLADRWGRFGTQPFPEGALAVVDRRVLRLHPHVGAQLEAARPRAVVSLRAGEGAKSIDALEQVLRAGVLLPRAGTLVCIGGGTLGDLATVAAHLLKRGVRLVQVPSTLLAAVDSSVGGKGAVHVLSGKRSVKNAAGVFHYAVEGWVCPELFETLSAKQRREGEIEAWKMVVCLDAARWERYVQRAPSLEALVKDARGLKDEVCRKDPYEQSGLRAVLNFGHTFGHVLESATGFRVSHGEAVGLGILCALDVGRAEGLTPEKVAAEVERAFTEGPGVLSRRALARALAPATTAEVARLLAADKKVGPAGELRMVLLARPGKTQQHEVGAARWKPLLKAWREGRRP